MTPSERKVLHGLLAALESVATMPVWTVTPTCQQMARELRRVLEVPEATPTIDVGEIIERSI